MLPPACRRTVDAGLKWGRRWPKSRLETLWSHRMAPIAGIATSGLRAAALGMQAAAHNLANLATPDAARQTVVLAARD